MTRAWTLLAVITLTAGCVTPYGEGQRSFYYAPSPYPYLLVRRGGRSFCL